MTQRLQVEWAQAMTQLLATGYDLNDCHYLIVFTVSFIYSLPAESARIRRASTAMALRQ